MPHQPQTIGLLLAGGILITLTGCAAGPTPVPTVDVNPIFTQAAGTIQANYTKVAALTPSATATLPPSDTPAPSATPADTDTPAATAPPAATDTATPSPERVELISQTPADDSIIAPNTQFTLTWSIRNAGTTTWTSAYRLRFFSGEQMGGRNSYALPKEVPPNGTVDISLTLTSPAKFGRIQTVWAITNASGHNFYALNGQYRIDYPLSASDTPTITPTGTITITVTPTVTTTPVPTATQTHTP
jgi:hypothetical protein